MSLNSSTDSLLNKIELWHKRLGHISENGLHYLNKQDVFGKDKVSKLDFVKSASQVSNKDLALIKLK